MVYIKRFLTESDKSACTAKNEYISYTDESHIVNIHPYDYSLDYLTFVARSSGIFKFSGITTANTIQYSTDEGETWSTAAQVVEVNVNNGDKVLWKGEMTPSGFPAYLGACGIGLFRGSTATFDAEGNVMSLLYSDDFANQTSLNGKTYAFGGLFGETNIVSAKNLSLPATTLANHCYYMMFQSDTSLTITPELPATTLANSCYMYMFQGCTSLTTAPELPATTLANSCYYYMFSNTNVLPDCTNIDFTSEIVVQSGGLRGLFAGTKVTDNDLMNILPINPSTNKYCLPATTLATQCYQYMFRDCTSLTTAPELPATTLANDCYYAMFYDCTSLTQAPTLPAITLTTQCYRDMFYGCISLTTAPQLSATTLADYCCYRMFGGCTSLTTAPSLPATTLANYCYNCMFQGCTNLNNITMLATNISASNCLYNWVSDVAANGTFTKAASMTTLPSGSNGIPNGWTVVDAT